MFSKSALLILAITFAGATLLQLRQQHVELMHEMATIHRAIDQRRHSMWDTQARMAQLLHPKQLEETIARVHLQLEPIAPSRSAGTAPQSSPPRALAARPQQRGGRVR